MACEEGDGKCFTFLWELENISFCFQNKGERIESLPFVVDDIGKTKWKLWLYPRGGTDGNYVGYFLQREADSNGADKMEIIYELAFIAKDGSVLRSENKIKRSFTKNSGFGFDKFEKREVVYSSMRSTFLPNDTLTLRCRIRKCIGEMREEVRCSARTRIGVEKRSFLWNLQNFSALESEKKYNYLITSIENDAALMSVDMSLTGGLSAGEIIRFELSLRDTTIKFATLQLFLIDSSGNKVKCNQDEFLFNSYTTCKQFTFIFTKKILLEKKNIYLADDVLSLHWEWAFSRGVIFEKIESVQFGSVTSDDKMQSVQNVKNKTKVSCSHTLTKIKSLYDKQFLCDVKLKTGTHTFPAHKIVLSASSSVFNAMFSNNMKEKEGEFVSIEDLSDDTVRHMLSYMYTEQMDVTSWESVSHLYFAADKYAILSLKNICSSYLKDNLSPNNACEVLLLADLHVDNNLKAAVQDYILKHDKEVIYSDEWKHLMETNAKLAAETLCIRYK